MARIRTATLAALAVGGGLTLLGLVLAGASALLGGSWEAGPEPWIGLGIAAVVWGLALTDLAAAVAVLLLPLGARRLLAVVPAAVLAFGWAYELLVAGPAGPGRPEHDVGDLFRADPAIMGVFLALTLLLVLPLLVSPGLRPRAGGGAPAR